MEKTAQTPSKKTIAGITPVFSSLQVSGLKYLLFFYYKSLHNLHGVFSYSFTLVLDWCGVKANSVDLKKEK